MEIHLRHFSFNTDKSASGAFSSPTGIGGF